MLYEVITDANQFHRYLQRHLQLALIVNLQQHIETDFPGLRNEVGQLRVV